MKHQSSKSILASATPAYASRSPAHLTAATFVQDSELQPGDLSRGSLFGRSAVAAAGQILAAGSFTITAPGAVYLISAKRRFVASAS